jgi:NAD(P)-dependent dehydrogenase (short-subunit alcohol dehydrogenase family)
MSKRVVLVTGGARGIGRAICQLFSTRGYDILFTYSKSLESAEELREQLRPDCRVESLRVDVGNEENVRELFEFCKVKFGYLDVLINCASHSSKSGWNAKPEQFDWPEWEKTIGVDGSALRTCGAGELYRTGVYCHGLD